MAALGQTMSAASSTRERVVEVARALGIDVTGPHVAPFNNLRIFGPIRSCRFDPHPDGPATEHQGIGVLYAAGTLQTSLAEVFQITRVIDCVTGAPAASVAGPGAATKPARPRRTWTSSARIDRAISSAVSAPRSTPAGARRAAYRSAGIPFSAR